MSGFILLITFPQGVVNTEDCGQEEPPVCGCGTAKLKKVLTEDTLLSYDSLILRVVCNVLDLYDCSHLSISVTDLY